MTELPERPTARIFVVDEADRVLLFRHLRPPAVDPTWIPPGGGVEPGEGLVAAAVRELREETGLTLPESALAGPVATAEGIWHSRKGDFFARHWYFLARVAHFELDTTRFEEHEQVVLTGHYWWSAEELSHTRERIRPLGLAALLPVLLASETGDPPAEPVRLAWASD